MSPVFKQTLAVSGGELNVLFYGNPNAAIKLVCVHGWTLDRRSFFGQKSLADNNVCVVLYDRRGFGENTLPPSFDWDLSDLSTLCESLGPKTIIYGVSQGARLALRLVAQRPDCAAGLILQGGQVDGLEVHEDAREAIPFAQFTELAKAGDLQTLHALWLQHPLLTGGVKSEQRGALADLVSAWRGTDLITPNALPRAADVTDKLASVRHPTLLLVGEHETRARQTHTAYLQRHLNAETVKIAHAGHLLNWSHPTESNNQIGQWLGSHFDYRESETS
jgi:pimeloyl-ACP methyl ester carboxylesterase